MYKCPEKNTHTRKARFYTYVFLCIQSMYEKERRRCHASIKCLYSTS